MAVGLELELPGKLFSISLDSGVLSEFKPGDPGLLLANEVARNYAIMQLCFVFISGALLIDL
ncbi:MAG: hypothetical protein QMB55_07565 [Propionivibrio sp.]